MERERHILQGLSVATGITWMAAVLFVAANPKGIDLAGDLAYDRANRVHTLAVFFLLTLAIALHRTIRTSGLPGSRAARLMVVGAALMLIGNVVSFWGALVVGEHSEEFWGGLVGWLTYLPGEILVLGTFIALALAARHWPDVGRAQRWTIGLAGVLLSITTATWAISPTVTLVPALLAAFALLAMSTTVANAAETTRRVVTAPTPTSAQPGSLRQTGVTK
jgi:hypothetical protein